MPGRTLIALTMLLALFGMGACSKVPRPSDQPSEIPDPQPHPTAHIAPNVQETVDSALNDPYAYEKLGRTLRRNRPPPDRLPRHGTGHRLVPAVHVPGRIRQRLDRAGHRAPLDPRRRVGPLHRPVEIDLAMTGLGLSDGTGPEGIEAEVMAVAGFDELEERAAEANGKIVLFDVPGKATGSVAGYRDGTEPAPPPATEPWPPSSGPPPTSAWARPTPG